MKPIILLFVFFSGIVLASFVIGNFEYAVVMGLIGIMSFQLQIVGMLKQ